MPQIARADTVTVFAAASLKNALDDVAAAWGAATEHQAILSFGGSSALARQIQAGAPADVFGSANVAWMDVLDAAGLIRTGTRRNLLRNRLVLIAADRTAAPLRLAAGVDLAGRLAGGRLAMALVEAVPAGIYGKAALENLGVWASVRDRVAQADNVRAALALVAAGEAPLGIVYATDAHADDRVAVLGVFAERSHPPIVYPAAIMAESRNALAPSFLHFLSGPAARRAFEAHGFQVVE